MVIPEYEDDGMSSETAVDHSFQIDSSDDEDCKPEIASAEDSDFFEGLDDLNVIEMSMELEPKSMS
jgi:hypothetical protein